MFGAMTDTQTGLKRIKALLPAGAIVVHKTGTQYTIDGVNGGTNDVGIAISPDGKRHILIAVYLKGSTLADDGRGKNHCPCSPGGIYGVYPEIVLNKPVDLNPAARC